MNTSMLTKDKIIPELLKQCPELRSDFEASRQPLLDDGKLITDRLDAHFIIRPVWKAHGTGQTELLSRFFNFIERLINEGDAETRTLVIECYLGKLQTYVTACRRGPELVSAYMPAPVKQTWEEMWRNPPEGTARLIEKRDQKRTEHLREYKISLTECAPGQQAVTEEDWGTGKASKFGGEPYWAQGNDYPECGYCKRPMTFVAQIDSIEHFCKSNPHSRQHRHGGQQWMFGDVGMIYVFFCFYCLKTKSLFQGG